MTRAALCLAALAAALPPSPCAASAPDDWLALAQTLAARQEASPAAALQAESIVRRAMRAARPGGETEEVEAAHRVLSDLFPQDRALLDAALESSEARLRGAADVVAATAGDRAAEDALRVGWPGGLDARDGEPPAPVGRPRLRTPPHEPAPLMLPAPPPGDPPPWSNPHAVSL